MLNMKNEIETIETKVENNQKAEQERLKTERKGQNIKKVTQEVEDVNSRSSRKNREKKQREVII